MRPKSRDWAVVPFTSGYAHFANFSSMYVTSEPIRAELQRMLFMNVKAEMQLLDDRGKLEDYLTRKLSQPAENLWLP